MSLTKTLAVAVAVTALASAQAFATTITNRDASPHLVYVTKSHGDFGEDSYDTPHLLAGKKSAAKVCMSQCKARLAGSSESVSFSGNDNLVISGGKLKKTN